MPVLHTGLENINMVAYDKPVNDLSPYVPCVVGDLMGTSIQGLGSLLQMPYGCGEQNMINFAPAIYIMDYLKATNQLTPEVKAKAVKVMESGKSHKYMKYSLLIGLHKPRFWWNRKKNF